jgi:hypothetical protein
VMLRTLTTQRTHLFPGARLQLDGHLPGEAVDVVLVFAEGAFTEARLSPGVDGFIVDVDEHRTVAGTSIPMKSWALEREANGALRVVRRVKD